MIRRVLPNRAARWVALAAAIALVLAVAVLLGNGNDDDGVAARTGTVDVPAGPNQPGTISLDIGFYLPEVTPAPAVLLAHGFGGSRLSVDAEAQRLVAEGFAVLAYSARGFGASEGLISLDSLDYEVADARALIDWLAEQPEVRLDGSGDPRVGVFGASYGGALALMAAGTDDRVDAVSAAATWNDLSQALVPNNGLTVDDEAPSADPGESAATGTPAAITNGPDGVFKQGWTATLLASVMGQAARTPGSHGSGGSDPDRGADDGAPVTNPPAPPDGGPLGPMAACGRLAPDLCVGYLNLAQTGAVSAGLAAMLERSSPAAVADNITAPTLLLQGQQDTLFGLDQADATARAIASAGTRVAVSWYPGGHNGGGLDDASVDRLHEWFRYYLGLADDVSSRGSHETGDTAAPGTPVQAVSGGEEPSAAFRYTVAGSVTSRGVVQYRTLELPSYPGLTSGPSQPGTDDVPNDNVTRIPLRGSAAAVLYPAGGQPAAITSLPGAGGTVSAALGAFAALPAQNVVFDSDVLSDQLVVTGSATVDLEVSRVPLPVAPDLPGASDLPGAPTTGDTSGQRDAVVYVSLIAVADGQDRPRNGEDPEQQGGSDDAPAASDPAGGAAGLLRALGGSPAGGAVAPVRIPNLPDDGSPVRVRVQLPAVAFQVDAGQRIGIRVATTDQGFFAEREPALYRVALADPTAGLTAPTVDGAHVAKEASPASWALAAGVLILLGLVGLLLVGRSRRRPTASIPRPAPAEPAPAQPAPAPLVIKHLAKTYPGGVQAVADVSLQVERGQVLGLLGPNGAGKTTALRMVMGLITPTSGTIRIFGEPAAPGAPVLSRIGSFVEGSGFLPHLSGEANLRLYWQSTGRPLAEAYLEEALTIADLGAAVRRKVKTYSQGMRQRLAIAQAMLGLPDLLLLDEPTNGLDPPQIHAMRQVLRGYAATGRTVLVSSHLLSEVEQTCTHVVVISRGRTVAAGSVADLVATSGEIAISTPDPVSAARIAGALSGVGDVEMTVSGIAVDLGSTPLDALLAALLDEGVSITSAAPRNRLEDVFLSLVATGPAGGQSALDEPEWENSDDPHAETVTQDGRPASTSSDGRETQ